MRITLSAPTSSTTGTRSLLPLYTDNSLDHYTFTWRKENISMYWHCREHNLDIRAEGVSVQRRSDVSIWQTEHLKLLYNLLFLAGILQQAQKSFLWQLNIWVLSQNASVSTHDHLFPFSHLIEASESYSRKLFVISALWCIFWHCELQEIRACTLRYIAASLLWYQYFQLSF